MYLCTSQRVWSSAATTSTATLLPSITSLVPLLSAAHAMSLVRIMRRAWAVLRLFGQVLLTCLLMDTFFLACVHQAANLPAFVNSSFSSSGNLSHQNEAPRPAAGASSPSSLPSLQDSETNSSSEISSSFYFISLLHNSETNSSTENSSKINAFPSAARRNSNSNGHSSNPARYSNNSKSDGGSSNADKMQANNRGQKHANNRSEKQAVSSQPEGRAGRQFPFALVVASSTAAVSILLFFCLSYVWHTRQLDRRAQKLAIRLAAESGADVNCSQCRTPTTYMAGSSQESGTDSGGEEVLPAAPLPRPVLDELNSLNEEDEEEAEAEEESRRKPGGVGRTLGSRRGRRGRRSGSRSSRKWSGHSGGQNRSSVVTDQEILNHFASRRHSTFFI